MGHIIIAVIHICRHLGTHHKDYAKSGRHILVFPLIAAEAVPASTAPIPIIRELRLE